MGGRKCAGAKRRHVDGRYLYAAEEMSAQSLAAVHTCSFVDVPQKEVKVVETSCGLLMPVFRADGTFPQTAAA